MNLTAFFLTLETIEKTCMAVLCLLAACMVLYCLALLFVGVGEEDTHETD